MIFAVVGITVVSLVLVQLLPLIYKGSHAAASFQANYNSGSYNANFSLGSPTGSTDTALPALNAGGYGGTNSLSYAYDGTSTLKYGTASNLPVDKGSIEMKFQKSAYGDATNQDVGSMNNPLSFAYDSTNDYTYVADRANSRIIQAKLNGDGTISNWLTFGNYGNGTGQFNNPSGIAYDTSSGYLYIFDSCNARIVKTKFNGDGWEAYGGEGSGIGQFSVSGCSGINNWLNPGRLDYDASSGYIFVSDRPNNRIVKTKMGGVGWTTLGGFSYPLGISYDSSTASSPGAGDGNIYIANNSSHNVIKTKIDGTGWTAYGSVGSGIGQFLYPAGIYYDASTDSVYISDSYNNRVVKTKLDGSWTGWQSYGNFAQPQQIYFDGLSTVYVADANNNRMVTLSSALDGTGWTAYGSYYKNLMKMSSPQGVAYDSSSGFYYISDTSNHRIIKTRIDGSGYQTFGSYGGGTNQFNLPANLYYESSTGYLYIADQVNFRIVKTQFGGTGWSTYTTTSVIGGAPMSMSNTDSDYLYIAMRDGSGNILKLKKDFTTASSLATPYSAAYGTVNYDPTSDFIYWFGPYSQGLNRMHPDGTGQDKYGSTGSGVNQMGGWRGGGIWYDSATEYFFIFDAPNKRLIKTQWGGTGWTTYGAAGSGVGQFNTGDSIYPQSFYDVATGYYYVTDSPNARIVRTQIDGTGWQTTNDFNAKEKVLYSAQATDDSRLVYDVLSRKLRFYLAYSNKAQFVETDPLTLTDGNWYTVKAHFNKANHTISIDLNGVEQATRTYDSDWGSLSYGTSFYIGARSGSTTDRWDGMIDDINIEITAVDTTAPTNPTAGNTHLYADGTKATEFASGGWGNAATPYITWSGASDTESGLKGYYLYFGTASDAEPNTTSGVLTANDGARRFQTHVGADGAEQHVSVPAAALTTGVTYYFILRTQDNDLNSADKVNLFTYKYDGGAPDPPEYINVSPAGCSTQSTFTFTWDAITDPTSGIAGYQYKKGSTGTATDAGNVVTLDLNPYQEGDNVLYLRTKDNAGNTSGWQTTVFCSVGQAYVIDGPAVTAGPSSITVTWVSSKTTTSYVQVYEGNTYISEQGHTSYDISHNVKVVGLEPEKAYRYKLVWTDSSGNLGESTWYQTVTATTPRILDLKSEIISPSKVIISWRTNYQSTAILKYGIGDYGNSVPIDGAADNFVRQIESLQGGTDYLVGIDASTTDGSKYSAGISFQTPPLPIVSALRFEPVADSAQPAVNASWSTNVETTSTIYYGVRGEARKEISQSDKVKEHKIKLENLSDNTTYEAYVTGIDQWGNTAKSDVNSFQTSLDTRPPNIENITIETSNVGLGKEDKAQATISYQTDEPTRCSVEYARGISGDTYDNKTADDEALIENHISVVSDLIPRTPYHLRIICLDKSSNRTESSSQTITSGQVQESIFNIILKTLNNLFGWLKIL